MAGDVAGCIKLTSDFFAKTRSRSAVFTDLFDAASRYVNQLWHQGRATGVDELRVARMIEVALVAMPITVRLERESSGLSALLVTMPSEAHDIGVRLVRVGLEEAGWLVRVSLQVDVDQIGRILNGVPYHLLGISVTYSGADVRTPLKAAVAAAHSEGIPVLIGGSAVERMPQLVDQVGADASARDARTAPVVGRKLVARFPGRHSSGPFRGRAAAD